MADILDRARQAAQRHAWAEAMEAFAEADREQALGPDDLKLLAEAAWWGGYPDESVEAYERAYTGYVNEGEKGAASRIAGWLAYLSFRRMAFSVGGGWMGKAEQLLEDEPEGTDHAWLALMHAAAAAMTGGDFEAASASLDHAITLAHRHGVPEVDAMATSVKGYVMIGAGMWQEGMALIDQAAAAAVSGELEDRIACDVYCNTIAACRNMADYGRAGEWTEEADRWMQRNSLGGYPGVCRVHRAELKRLHGSYSEAEQQARVACEELERYRLLDSLAFAHKEIGEVRLRRGDLDSAEEAFKRAYEYGSDAQPGLALLLLARGDAEGAARSIASSLEEGDGAGEEDSTTMQLSRSRLLPAQVKIALANNDPDAARSAADELDRIAAQFERPAFEAGALTARGAIALAEGQADEASATLDRAWRAWRNIDFPYESAQARVLLGQAKAAAGDEATARMDLDAARSSFERLGAVFDVRWIDELLGDEATPTAGDGRRVTRTFMFTDIVTSTDLVGLIGDEAWEDLLRWHDHALRSELARHRGHEVRHTGDGFFVAFDDAADGVEAAVAIQRKLAEHRREHGFAPWVRIGLHTAEATPQGNDFAGKGVHVAARVGDIGEREEIVVSADTLAAAGAIRFAVSEVRSVALKGVSEDVDVHTIDWR
jgi:class 3 adenylate cyclase